MDEVSMSLHTITSLLFIIVPIIIALSCYYEARLIIKRNNCSLLKAMKISNRFHRKKQDDNEWLDEPISGSDELCSPAYSHLPGNIYHNR
jgi:hypothetical protein